MNQFYHPGDAGPMASPHFSVFIMGPARETTSASLVKIKQVKIYSTRSTDPGTEWLCRGHWVWFTWPQLRWGILPSGPWHTGPSCAQNITPTPICCLVSLLFPAPSTSALIYEALESSFLIVPTGFYHASLSNSPYLLATSQAWWGRHEPCM